MSELRREIQIGQESLILETGKIAKQADGSWKAQVDAFNTDGPPIAAEES